MKPLIVANWKCNPITQKEARRIFGSIKKGLRKIKNKNTEVVICPPFSYLSVINDKLSVIKLGAQSPHLCISVGAQDCFWEEKGAFTGEISLPMLKDLGCKYVIVGHSERRKYFQETDEIINKKIKAALGQDLNAILCVNKVSQIKKDLKDIPKKQFKNLILAYEPVFAIGTGKPCGIEKAKEMNILIRKTLKTNTPILYGGSVNSKNAAPYLKEAKMNGLLIGNASLDPKEFIKIIRAVNSSTAS